MCHIKIQGEQGLVFEREISEELGEELILIVIERKGLVQSSGESRTLKSAEVKGKNEPLEMDEGDGQVNVAPVGVRGYWRLSGAVRGVDKIVAIGCYLRQQGEQFFDREAIVGAFEEAAQPVPKNLSRDIGCGLSFPLR